MIDLYYWPTPNGWKISIALEEMELDYEVKYVNIGRGEQFEPEFLAISPNNRMPAIVDHAPEGGGDPVAIFESGAILIYLAEKSGRFLPTDLRGRSDVLQWLMWQMGGLGPMLGQNHHFKIYAPEPIPYAIDRYTNETRRLYSVLDGQLAEREYICGDVSIADMACWSWVVPHERQGIDFRDYPNVGRWYEKMKTRPALRRGFDLGKDIRKAGMDEQAKSVLFGQTRAGKS
ncbi:MAG: glutathione S-transferase N-terminal domain-containing protein [Myxococcota bacterium]